MQCYGVVCNSCNGKNPILLFLHSTGEMIVSSQKYHVQETPVSLYETRMTVTVRKFQKEDIGSYRCIAKNSLGEVDSSIRLYGKSFEFVCMCYTYMFSGQKIFTTNCCVLIHIIERFFFCLFYVHSFLCFIFIMPFNTGFMTHFAKVVSYKKIYELPLFKYKFHC